MNAPQPMLDPAAESGVDAHAITTSVSLHEMRPRVLQGLDRLPGHQRMAAQHRAPDGREIAAARLCETDELKPRVRSTLRALTESFVRWARLVESQPHSEVAQTILEESGYTEMWQKDRSADAV